MGVTDGYCEGLALGWIYGQQDGKTGLDSLDSLFGVMQTIDPLDDYDNPYDSGFVFGFAPGYTDAYPQGVVVGKAQQVEATETDPQAIGAANTSADQALNEFNTLVGKYCPMMQVTQQPFQPSPPPDPPSGSNPNASMPQMTPEVRAALNKVWGVAQPTTSADAAAGYAAEAGISDAMAVGTSQGAQEAAAAGEVGASQDLEQASQDMAGAANEVASDSESEAAQSGGTGEGSAEEAEADAQSADEAAADA